MTDKFTAFDFDSFVKFIREHTKLQGHTEVSRKEDASPSDLRWIFDSTILVAGMETSIRCGIDGRFPASLPQFLLREQPKDRLLPHVGPDGSICYQEKEGLVINWKDPEGIFDQALDKVHGLLLEGYNGTNDGEFLDEIGYYWSNFTGTDTISSILDPSKRHARKVVLLTYTFELLLPQRIQIQFVGDTKKELEAFLPNFNPRFAKREYSYAWFVPLEEYRDFPVPAWKSFWDAHALERAIYPRVSDATKSKLRANKGEKLKEIEHLVLSLPLPNGSNALLGVKIETKGFRSAGEGISKYEFVHSIIAPRQNSTLSPVKIQRMDESYLIERGGGSIPLKDKHVLVVGCGAVGSIAAMEMAKAGIGEITLVDFDILSVDNSHRHLLGFNDGCLSFPKVSMVKMEIEKQIRHVKVHERKASIESLISMQNFSISEFDLVFLATGNPTTELLVNEWLAGLPDSPPAVYAWVEALGIGGHLLLANNNAGVGCLKCLHTPHPDDEPDAFYNRASFAERDQFFAKTVAGCGTRFTPFSALDASRTAIEGVRLVIDALKGDEPGHPLRSWKGNSKEFLKQGFKLSRRFQLNEVELDTFKYEYQNPNCSVCGSKKP